MELATSPARLLETLQRVLETPPGELQTALQRTNQPLSAPQRKVGLDTRKKVEGGALAQVQVVDRGPGIPPEVLPGIFERFTRGKSSAGLGLGLDLARRIAAAHGGELTIESAPGQGMRFHLTFRASGRNADRSRADARARRFRRFRAKFHASGRKEFPVDPARLRSSLT